ncbi:MAG: hypothetical protein ACHQ0Y_11460 [Thermodesulfovibrionales bacterium]
MDNYIVRIYRREKDNPRVLAGLVEEVGTKGKKAFNDLDDLWEILNFIKRDTNGRREKSARLNKKIAEKEENTKGHQ